MPPEACTKGFAAARVLPLSAGHMIHDPYPVFLARRLGGASLEVKQRGGFQLRHLLAAWRRLLAIPVRDPPAGPAR